jgi:hypothetical protein
MLLRSLLLLAGLLLLVAALASLVAPREVTSPRTTTALRPTPGPSAAALADRPSPVRWELPGKRLARANVGDIVEIVVTSARRDVAELPKLALVTPVGDGLPATLRFVANQPGRFSVLLRYAARKLGVLQVEPR